MQRILLVGNPNAGKSTLFNAITGGRAQVGNWHGVTVGVSEKVGKLGGKEYVFCDLPGVYSLQPMSREEGLSVDYLNQYPDAKILLVAECASLPSVLPLLNGLKGRTVALLLTKRKRFEKRGGKIYPDRLSEKWGIPVYTTERGKRSRKAAARALHSMQTLSNVDACLSSDCYRAEETTLSLADKWLTNGLFCLPFFLFLLISTFYLTFAPSGLGEWCKGKINYFFCEFLAGLAEGVSSPVLRSFLIDGVLNGVGGVLCFLPQIAILFFVLNGLEESGLISRIALHTDGFFSKFGLNGRAVFSLLMGFGCTTSAILSTRGMENRRLQKRTVLALPYIPCSAKLPVFLTLSVSFFANPFYACLLLYALGVGIALLVAVFSKEEGEDLFLLELAPLQIPNVLFLLKSLLFQLKQFIIKTATIVLAFFLLSWLLSSFNFRFQFCGVEESMLASVCGWLRWLFAPIGANDWKIAYCALSGLVAKENVAGLLSVFYGGFPYSAQSAFAFAIFLLTCSPCVSAIGATAKEMGLRFALLSALLQTVSALLLSYLVYFALTGGWLYCLFAVIIIFAYLLIRKKSNEKIPRTRADHAQKLHR